MAITLLTGTLIRSGSIPTTALGGGVISSSTQITTALPGGTVSSSAQVKILLPDGTVSSSAQYPGWVTASGQVDITQTTGYSTFSSSLSIVDANQQTEINALKSVTSSYALQSQLAGVASSSAQVKIYLPDGTVSSSTQVTAFLPGGTVSSSGQVDITATTGYTTFSSSLSTVDANQTTRIDNLSSATSSYALQSQLAGVASSSAQVKTYLPDGTVSSSAQISLNGITGTTFATANFTFPQNLTVGGTLTAQEIQTEYVTSSIIYESGSTKFGDTADDTHQFTGSLSVLGSISGTLVLPSGIVTASSQIDYNLITNKLSGVVSSSTQVALLLPNGTVSSSAQYPGWVTASSQVDYNSITNKLSGVISSSAQFNALSGTSASFATTATTASYISGNIQFNNGLDITGSLLVVGAISASSLTGSILAPGVVSSSAQYPGWVTASSQIDYNSIQNKLSGVYSSSAFTSPSQGTARLTLNGVALTDVDLGVQTTDTPTFSGVSSSNHITPTVDNTYNLGAPDKRWANIYTGDLILSNEGSSGNIVDGTTGNWTIQEGEEHLYIINNKSGKKYRFMLSEIE